MPKPKWPISSAVLREILRYYRPSYASVPVAKSRPAGATGTG